MAAAVAVRSPTPTVLAEAGDAVDAIFKFINTDKLKLADLFTRIDKDRSGSLQRGELEMCLDMLHVPAQKEHLDAIMDVLDVDGDGCAPVELRSWLLMLIRKFDYTVFLCPALDTGKQYSRTDGNVVISEFFIRMNQLKEMVKHERRRLADSKAASQRAAAKAAAAKRRHGTATNFFFTVLRSRAGIGPGVTAPDDWNRIDSDGARGVVPSWPKPPKSKKDARKLQGKPPAEAEGWVPALAELVLQVGTPLDSVSPEFTLHNSAPLAGEVHPSWTAADLQGFFTELRLVDSERSQSADTDGDDDAQISRLDELFVRFENLERLRLTGNEIEVIENLPPKLRELDLNSNKVSALPDLSHLPLCHLGLGYNLLTDEGCISSLADQSFENLISLDLSYNNLTDLPAVLAALVNKPKLQQLYLCGNPFALRRQYRMCILAELPNLTMLDDQPVTWQEVELASDMKAQVPTPSDGIVRVHKLAGLESADVALLVNINQLVVASSEQWPKETMQPAEEEGGEPVVVPAEAPDMSLYRYSVEYRLVDSMADPNGADPPIEKVGASLEPLELGEDKTAAANYTLTHTAPAEVCLRDAIVGGRLLVTLSETYSPPPPEPEGDQPEGVELNATSETPSPQVLAQGKLSLDTFATGLSQGAEIKARVDLLPLVSPVLVRYEKHPDRKQRVKGTLSYTGTPSTNEAQAVAIATIEIGVCLNVEEPFPPEPPPPEDADPVDDKKKKKKKKKK